MESLSSSRVAGMGDKDVAEPVDLRGSGGHHRSSNNSGNNHNHHHHSSSSSSGSVHSSSHKGPNIANPTYQASSTDYSDMVRGEGDWRNIQEIFRKSFKFAFDQIDKQQTTINQLVEVVGSLKAQLATKANVNQIDDIFSAKVRSTVMPASREEIDEMRQSLADVKADLQRKPTIRYVDDSLRRKVDKTDMLVKSLAPGGQSYTGVDGAMRISTDIGELKAKFEAMSRTVGDLTEHMGTVAAKNETAVLREQLNECFKLISERPTRAKFDELMSHKVELSHVDAQLSLKSDKLQMSQHLGKQDALLSEHERSLTALKLAVKSLESELTTNFTNTASLNVNNPLANLSNTLAVDAEMDSIWTIPNRPAVNQGNPDSSYKASSSSSSSTAGGVASGEGGEFWSMIAESRNSSIIQNLFHNVKGLSADIKRVRESEKSMSQRLLHVETTANNLADIKTVETIGLVLEEQKLRIDSIITGTTVISDVRNELDRLSLENVVVREYLGITSEMSPAGRVPIPEKHALTTKLKEFGAMLEAVGNRLGEVSTALGRAAVRLEAVEKGQRSNSTRVDVLEDVVPKFELVSRICNLSGSKYETLLDVANHMKELAGTLRDLQGQFVGLDSKSTHFINEITTRTSGVFQDMNKLDAKMASLHENIEVVNDNEIYWQKELKALKKMVKKILIVGSENINENESKINHSRRQNADFELNNNQDSLLTAIAKSKASYENIMHQNPPRAPSLSSSSSSAYSLPLSSAPGLSHRVSLGGSQFYDGSSSASSSSAYNIPPPQANPNNQINPAYGNSVYHTDHSGLAPTTMSYDANVGMHTSGVGFMQQQQPRQNGGHQNNAMLPGNFGVPVPAQIPVSVSSANGDDLLRLKGAKIVDDLRREKLHIKNQINSFK